MPMFGKSPSCDHGAWWGPFGCRTCHAKWNPPKENILYKILMVTRKGAWNSDKEWFKTMEEIRGIWKDDERMRNEKRNLATWSK